MEHHTLKFIMFRGLQMAEKILLIMLLLFVQTATNGYTMGLTKRDVLKN